MFYHLRFLCGKNFPYIICGELFWRREPEVEIYMMMVIASQSSVVLLISLVFSLCLEHLYWTGLTFCVK
jgi:hypothetical protein